MQKNNPESQKNSVLASSNNDELEKFRYLLNELSEEYINKFDEISGKRKKGQIPINIFNKKLSPLETVAKYLKENTGLSFKAISDLINRSQKTVWQAYNNSRKKNPARFQDKYSQYHVEIFIFKDRKFSILESTVSYLKENYGLNYHNIAVLLGRDERTIWTVYNRVKNKRI